MFTRREFLEHGAVAVGVALRPGASLARSPQSTSGMCISLNSSLTRQLEWPEFARLAARVGYCGVDVNLNAAKAQGADATRALFNELTIRPTVTGLPVQFGGPTPPTDDSLKQLEDTAAFASTIGCPRMMAVLPPSAPSPKAEYRPIIKDRVTAIAAILHRSNVRLGLEFLGPVHFRTRQPYEFIWRMDEALELAKECGPNVGLTLDAWHWHHAGATVDDILAAGKSRIVHVHVSDAKAMPPEDVRDNQRVMPGEGVIDLTAFFRALQKIGYEDGVSPEPLGRVPSDMSAEAGARLGLETTIAVMKKAGVI
jgi:sugar phosphate isomerase/epimerase